MDDLEQQLRATLDRVEEAGQALRARDPIELAIVIAEAWNLIAEPELPPGHAAREALPESTGLSLPSVAWALAETLRDVEPQLVELARRMAPPPGTRSVSPRLGALVLAGNVFTSCVQPLSVALIARAPIVVKASSRDDVLPRLFHAALAQVDPALADACAIFSFPGEDSHLQSTLLARADVVSAYGSDRTLSSLRARLPASTHFIAHGHGLGAAFVARSALASERETAATVERLAQDVAAYDQRGCLSPHAIYVEGDARGLAVRLADALERYGQSIPRGPLPPDVGASQVQWRGLVTSRGELFEGDGFAVGYEAGEAFRVSPGWRNVMVLDAANASAFVRAMQPLGAHLKAVGVAGGAEAKLQIAERLPPPLAPRVVSAGAMQRPALTDCADGRPAWEGWLRYLQTS